jgi:uncharacterized membrane protein YccC
LSPTKVSVGATSARGAAPEGAPAAEYEGAILRSALRYALPMLLGLGLLTALALAAGAG